jgi:probable F420-dependent oxidoreductase
VSPDATFGYVLPSSTGADVPGPDLLWPIVDEAEHGGIGGIDALWVSDHVHWWRPMHDSLSLLAALAARTQRVRIGTAVLLAALRNPVTLAKALATIERFAPGRLIVGCGLGGEFSPEWEAVGVDRATRARRTDQIIQILRGLWGPAPFSFESKLISIPEIGLHPKPTAPPPIWIGGRSEPAINRAARHGDGWMGIWLTPDRYAQRLSALREKAEELGRDPKTIASSLYVWTSIAGDDESARTQAESLLGAFYNLPFERLEKYAVWGSPKRCAEKLSEFIAAGAQHIAIAPITADVSPTPLRRLMEDVIPLI